MAEMRQVEFFLLQYVPDVVKGEFINVGLVMVEATEQGFVDVRFMREWRRLKGLDADVDTEMLDALERDIRGNLGDVKDREGLMKRLQDSFSNAIQLSATKGSLTVDPVKEIETMARLYLESAPRPRERETGARQRIVAQMRSAFEQAGVWELMRKQIAVAAYTYKGDPLKIDCGYRPNGVIQMFHGVSLERDVNEAKVMGFSFPQMVAGMAREEKAEARLTAVVEDGLDRSDEGIEFALTMMERSGIVVARVGEMGELAERARREMRV